MTAVSGALTFGARVRLDIHFAHRYSTAEVGVRVSANMRIPYAVALTIDYYRQFVFISTYFPREKKVLSFLGGIDTDKDCKSRPT